LDFIYILLKFQNSSLIAVVFLLVNNGK